MRNLFAYLFLVVGIALFAFSFAYDATTIPDFGRFTDSIVSSLTVDNEDLLHGVAKVEAEVNCPKVVGNETFLVGLQCRVESVEERGMKADQDRQARFQEDLFRRIGVYYNLEIAGDVDIKPDGPNRVSADGRAFWSVSPKEVKPYAGTVSLDLESLSKRIGRIEVEDATRPLRFEVKKPVLTLSNVWKAIVRFLGPLMTLPGILAFYERWKAKRDEIESRKPEIITDV